MMDDRPGMDYRRDIDGLGYPSGMRDDANMTIPALIIVAILIIGGYFVVTYNSDNVRTATNMPGAERSAPAPRAPAATPAPATTPPSAPTPAPAQ